jgi:predicted transcriptional regulator YdeE
MTQPRAFRNDPFTVLGFAVRTDGPGSAIQDLWGRVYGERLLESIPGRVDGEVFGVYTNLEDAGRSRRGWFTFLVGARVDPATAVPEGMTLVSVPASDRAVVDVPDGDPARVLEAWAQAWAFDDDLKTFLCEYEQYTADGASVVLGVRGTRG